MTELVQYNINKGIEDYKNSKNETAKQLIEFLDNGGKVEDLSKFIVELIMIQ